MGLGLAGESDDDGSDGTDTTGGCAALMALLTDRIGDSPRRSWRTGRAGVADGLELRTGPSIFASSCKEFCLFNFARSAVRLPRVALVGEIDRALGRLGSGTALFDCSLDGETCRTTCTVGSGTALLDWSLFKPLAAEKADPVDCNPSSRVIDLGRASELETPRGSVLEPPRGRVPEPPNRFASSTVT